MGTGKLNRTRVLQFPSDGGLKWGFDYDKTKKRYEWFKLEQDPKYTKDELKRAYPATTILPGRERKLQDLITEFLRSIRKHVERSIRDSMDIGGQNRAALLRDIRWEYIITVPAMWPETAQHMTEKCAKEAGMAPNGYVQIIPEPEAAGIYALDEMCQELEIKQGDTFVICDAGGG